MKDTVMKESTQVEEYNWKDTTILIAEDIDLNFLYLSGLFKLTGATVLRAPNGKEAVEVCEIDAKIDIVLMDLQMPVMNGYEATRRIKKFRPDLPVIAQTAYVQSEDRAHAVAAGCDDFIAKPIHSEELFKKIVHLLQQKKEILSS
jgi:two-component system, cell cycle response regulator DivK